VALLGGRARDRYAAGNSEAGKRQGIRLYE
jgi:hypothetical protein